MSWIKMPMRFPGKCVVCSKPVLAKEIGFWAKGLGVKHEKCATTSIKELQCSVCGASAGCASCEFSDVCDIPNVSQLCICPKCSKDKNAFDLYRTSTNKKFPHINSWLCQSLHVYLPKLCWCRVTQNAIIRYSATVSRSWNICQGNTLHAFASTFRYKRTNAFVKSRQSKAEYEHVHWCLMKYFICSTRYTYQSPSYCQGRVMQLRHWRACRFSIIFNKSCYVSLCILMARSMYIRSLIHAPYLLHRTVVHTILSACTLQTAFTCWFLPHQLSVFKNLCNPDMQHVIIVHLVKKPYLLNSGKRCRINQTGRPWNCCWGVKRPKQIFAFKPHPNLPTRASTSLRMSLIPISDNRVCLVTWPLPTTCRGMLSDA